MRQASWNESGIAIAQFVSLAPNSLRAQVWRCGHLRKEAGLFASIYDPEIFVPILA